jgi:monofunctional biosynthetic peptidoglycan transglycosylase
MIRIMVTILAVPVLITLVLRAIDPPTSALMVLRKLKGQTIDHRPVPLAEVAPALRFAVIAAEDNLFCSHSGFDWKALSEQLALWRAGGRPRGASTISQQTAKNLFLWPGRDPLRKLLEVPLTLLLEAVWPKQRILEVYLQIVELGPGIFGAEAAAQHWFKKPASRLTRREAAQLAAMLPAPLTRKPTQRGVQQRAVVIDRRIDQLGPLLDCAR